MTKASLSKSYMTILAALLVFVTSIFSLGYSFTLCHSIGSPAHLELAPSTASSCDKACHCCQKIEGASASKSTSYSDQNHCQHEVITLSSAINAFLPIYSHNKQLPLKSVIGEIVLPRTYDTVWILSHKHLSIFQQKPPPYNVSWLQFVQIKQATVIQV